MDMHSKLSNDMQTVDQSSVDNVVDGEAAELMLVDREVLDWQEDLDGELEVNGDCASEEEGDSMDMCDGLGSDPESRIDTDD